jgi:hypothetical protein
MAMVRQVAALVMIFTFASSANAGSDCSPLGERGCLAGKDLSLRRVDFSCDGRHLCKQMRSCEEAYYFLEQCGVTSLDRDHDGVPCEAICG